MFTFTFCLDDDSILPDLFLESDASIDTEDEDLLYNTGEEDYSDSISISASGSIQNPTANSKEVS